LCTSFVLNALVKIDHFGILEHSLVPESSRMGLPECERILTLNLAILTQYETVTDEHLLPAQSALCTAMRNKK